MVTSYGDPTLTTIDGKNIISGVKSGIDFALMIEAAVEAQKIGIREVEDSIDCNHEKLQKLEEFTYVLKKFRSSVMAVTPKYGNGVFDERELEMKCRGFSFGDKAENYMSVSINRGSVLTDFEVSDISKATAKSVEYTGFISSNRSVTSGVGETVPGKFKPGSFRIVPVNIKNLQEEEVNLVVNHNISQVLLDERSEIYELNASPAMMGGLFGNFFSTISSCASSRTGNDLTITMTFPDGAGGNTYYISDPIMIEQRSVPDPLDNTVMTTEEFIPERQEIIFRNNVDAIDFKVRVGEEVSFNGSSDESDLNSNLMTDIAGFSMATGKYFSGTKFNGDYAILNDDKVGVFSNDIANINALDNIDLSEFAITQVTSEGAADATMITHINSMEYSATGLGNQFDEIDQNIILTSADGNSEIHINLKDAGLKVNVSTRANATNFENIMNRAFSTKRGAEIRISSGDSLNGIMKKINNYTSSSGVRAGITKLANNNFKLKILADNVGLSNGFNIIDTNGSLTSLSNLQSITQPRMCTFNLDGVLITRDSNEVDDVVSGVVVNFIRNTSSTEFIEAYMRPNLSTITERVVDFVNTYNLFKEFVAVQNEQDMDGKYSKNAILHDNVALSLATRLVDSSLVRLVNNGDSTIQSLLDIGINYEDTYESQLVSNKILNINRSRFQSMLESKFDDVKKLFSFTVESSDTSISKLKYTGNEMSLNFQVSFDLDVNAVVVKDIDAGDIFDKELGLHSLYHNHADIPKFVGKFNDILGYCKVKREDGATDVHFEASINSSRYISDPMPIISYNFLTNPEEEDTSLHIYEMRDAIAANTEIQLHHSITGSGFSINTAGDAIDISTSDLLDDLGENLRLALLPVELDCDLNDVVRFYDIDDEISVDVPISKAAYTPRKAKVSSHTITEKNIFESTDINEIFNLADGDGFTVSLEKPDGTITTVSLIFEHDFAFETSGESNDHKFSNLNNLHRAIKNNLDLDSQIFKDSLVIEANGMYDRIYFSNDGDIDFLTELGIEDINYISGSVEASKDGVLNGIKFEYSGDPSGVIDVNISKGISYTTLLAIDSILAQDGAIELETKGIETHNERRTWELERQNKNVDTHKQGLIEKYSKLEESLAKAEDMTKFIESYVDILYSKG